MMTIRYLALVGAGALLFAGCVAPLARTSEVGSGVGFEVGGGLSAYRGGKIVKDTSTWWGNQAVLRDVNAGPFGSVRVSYGHRNRYGGDLTVAGGYGPALRSGDEAGGWVNIALAGKMRPWKSNHLFFAELGIPQLAVGWTGGFPSNRPERVSVTVKTGSKLPEDFVTRLTRDDLGNIVDELLPPSMVQCNVAFNLRGRRGGFRVSPNAGFGVNFDWSPFKAGLSHFLAGVSIAP